MNTVPTLCPEPETLAQLVSGSLIESEAENLFAHIDSCSACQFQVDELARKRDPLIAVAADHSKPADNAHLSRLIRAAQNQATADTRTRKASTTKAVSVADFVAGLRKSGLIEGNELNQLLDDLSWDGMGQQDDDSNSLAKALVHQQKLTPFQARLLLRGKWQGLVLGNYAILDKLGQGGMGSVFKARHIRMGRVVCLKVVNAAGRQSPAVIERFRNEARALAALSHRNIVVAHDADEAKGIPYLVMEYIDGDDLAKRVRKLGPLTVPQSLEVGIQTARALWYAHGQGVIHRDIKPHNLVGTFDDAGAIAVKVLDLGLARFDTLMTYNPDASVLAAMTNTGVVIGTVDYMAPEQALDSRNADSRSDIYSLGCTLFFLLSGRSPFSGDTVMQRLIAHREQSAPNLHMLVDGVSPQLNAVIHKMLAKKPEQRYQTMDQALQDLQAVADGVPPSVKVDFTDNATTAQTLERASAPNPQESASIQIQLAEESSTNIPRAHLRSRRIVMAGGVLAVVGLIITAAYALLPPGTTVVEEPPPPPPRVGADLAIRNGGEGRALVLVSSKDFDKGQLAKLTQVLGLERHVDIVLASKLAGTGQAEAHMEIRQQYDNVNLKQAKAADFDSVFILGGETRELSHKEPETQQHVKRIVSEALENGIMITGCQQGFHNVLHDTKLIYQEPYKHRKDSLSYETCDADQLAKQAVLIFDKLKSEQQSPKSPSEDARRGT